MSTSVGTLVEQQGRVNISSEGRAQDRIAERTNMLREAVGLEPGDRLASNLYLVVDTLDREENLAQGFASDDVELPLGHEPSAVGGEVLGKVRGGCRVDGEEGEERDQGEGVGEVSNSRGEGRVPVRRSRVSDPTRSAAVC